MNQTGVYGAFVASALLACLTESIAYVLCTHNNILIYMCKWMCVHVKTHAPVCIHTAGERAKYTVHMHHKQTPDSYRCNWENKHTCTLCINTEVSVVDMFGCKELEDWLKECNVVVTAVVKYIIIHVCVYFLYIPAMLHRIHMHLALEQCPVQYNSVSLTPGPWLIY